MTPLVDSAQSPGDKGGGQSDFDYDRDAIDLIIEWSEHADLVDIFTIGVDVFFEISPSRDVIEGWVTIERDCGLETRIPVALFKKTMAYVRSHREQRAGRIPRQPLFLDRFGHRFSLAAFCRELRAMLSQASPNPTTR